MHRIVAWAGLHFIATVVVRLLHSILLGWPEPSNCNITNGLWSWNCPGSFQEAAQLPTQLLTVCYSSYQEELSAVVIKGYILGGHFC